MIHASDSRMRRRLIAQLHTDAMLLADEARTYFEEAGRAERDGLKAFERVTFSCESLKVTTRLTHVIAWLLMQRAIEAGEVDRDAARSSDQRLGTVPESDDRVLANLPDTSRALANASIDLHRRAARLDRAEETSPASPVRSLQARLAATF